jgi:hypothetical protein
MLSICLSQIRQDMLVSATADTRNDGRRGRARLVDSPDGKALAPLAGD